MSFQFWHRWMFAGSIAFAVVGILAAFHPFNLLFAPWNHAIARTLFDEGWTAESAAYHAFLAGPLGGTIAAFYVLQAVVVAVPFKRRERWSWHAIVWATLTWFVIDSTVSIWHGATFNVYMVNVLPLLVFGPPLAATFTHMAPGVEMIG